MENKRKLSLGNIISLILVSMLIVGLIVASFFLSNEKYVITAAIITLISFLVLIVLSGMFDKLSVGKLFSVSRLAEENKKRADQLQKEKDELVLKMINLTTSQNQSSYNIFGSDIASMLSVQSASKEEKEEMEEQNELQAGKENSIQPRKQRRILSRQKFEDMIFNKYFGASRINSVIRDAKVVSQFKGVDPISVRSVVFDGYINENMTEIFIEVARNGFPSVLFHDRLYIMLSKIKYYKEIKKSNAYLLLLVANLTEEDERSYMGFDRLKEFFSPAIASGLLKIEFVEIDKAETEQLYEER